MIATKDVIAYIQNRPEQGSKPITALKKMQRYGYHLPDHLPDRFLEQLRKAYDAAFEKYPEVLTIEQISRVIGYAYDTIFKWTVTRNLKSITAHNKRMIPKEWLFEFLLSPAFLTKSVPSDWQIVIVHRALVEYKKEEEI